MGSVLLWLLVALRERERERERERVKTKWQKKIEFGCLVCCKTVWYNK